MTSHHATFNSQWQHSNVLLVQKEGSWWQGVFWASMVFNLWHFNQKNPKPPWLASALVSTCALALRDCLASYEPNVFQFVKCCCLAFSYSFRLSYRHLPTTGDQLAINTLTVSLNSFTSTVCKGEKNTCVLAIKYYSHDKCVFGCWHKPRTRDNHMPSWGSVTFSVKRFAQSFVSMMFDSFTIWL